MGPGLKSPRQVSRRGRFKEQSRVPGCSQSHSSGGKILVVHGRDYTITSIIASNDPFGKLRVNSESDEAISSFSDVLYGGGDCVATAPRDASLRRATYAHLRFAMTQELIARLETLLTPG